MSRVQPRIAFVLGKPVRNGSVFPAVFRHLRRCGVPTRVHLPHEADDLTPPWLSRSALIVHRGLKPAALDALADLEWAGSHCCNPVAPTVLVQDRYSLLRRLDAAGLPVPRSTLAMTWPEVLARAQGGAMVVKAVDGSRGRGVGVVRLDASEPPIEAPFRGPYIMQEQIATDGWDRKVYVMGRACRGLLKSWPRRDPRAAQPFVPEPLLCDLALAVGQILELEIYGVDFVAGETEPRIVDVNVFPGFKGVPGAARLIADHLLRSPDP